MHTLTLHSPIEKTLPLASLTGEEAVNALFDLRAVALLALDDPLMLNGAERATRSLLGARVTVKLGDGAVSARRHGIVSEARVHGAVTADDGTHVRVTFRVVPGAWLLTQRRRSRIFQRKYPHEIASAVLDAAGVRHRWKLSNLYPRRIYCTQYDETDWEFLTRIFAEEGVFFFFEHPLDAVLPDAPSGERADDRARAAALISGVGAAARAAGGVTDIGALSIGGGAAQMLSDLVAAPDDDEAPLPREGGAGRGGPKGLGEVLVFADQVSHYASSTHDDDDALPLEVTLRREVDVGVDDSYAVTSFSPHDAVRPGVVEHRDYDFRRPLLLLRATSSAEGARRYDDESRYDLESYEHHGEYESPDVTAENARNSVQQHQTRASLARAEGMCPRLMPGHRFNLHNGPGEHAREGGYVPLRVVHHAMDPHALAGVASDPREGLARATALAIHEATRARDPITGDDAWTESELYDLLHTTAGAYQERRSARYRCVVECVRDDVPARPPRPRRAPKHVTETATVVGPRGEEIYTDRFGRVKVQFHWDRDGEWDEHSSCWVRVAQPWAGAGYGFAFVPRVGMEVVVAFVRGDPDRPVILGALYNGTHEPPEPLPHRKTRSAIRTQSSPDGGGFNELAFEDQKGTERVTLRAQKDLELIANDHHARTVRGSETVIVGDAQSVTVGGEQHTAVRSHQSAVVGGAQSVTVRGDRAAHVGRNESARVEGDRHERVEGSASSDIRGDVSVGINGARTTVLHGDERVLVGVDSEHPSHQHVRVTGSAVTRAHVINLLSDGSRDGGSISLECGSSRLTLTRDFIAITSKSIFISGEDETVVRGKDANLNLTDQGFEGNGDPISLQTLAGASLVLSGARASLHGDTVRLEPDSAMGSGDVSEEGARTPNVTLRFTHGFLPGDVPTFTLGATAESSSSSTRRRDPTAMAKVLAKVEGAITDDRQTDEDGLLRVWVAGDAHTFTVQLNAHETYPSLYRAEDDPMVFTVKLEESVPPASDLAGARFRLRNLGYSPCTELSAAPGDAATAAALVDYQFDRSLPRSGALDAATRDDFNTTWNG